VIVDAPNRWQSARPYQADAIEEAAEQAKEMAEQQAKAAKEAAEKAAGAAKPKKKKKPWTQSDQNLLEAAIKTIVGTSIFTLLQNKQT
jgi:hypothetical protein